MDLVGGAEWAAMLVVGTKRERERDIWRKEEYSTSSKIINATSRFSNQFLDSILPKTIFLLIYIY